MAWMISVLARNLWKFLSTSSVVVEPCESWLAALITANGSSVSCGTGAGVSATGKVSPASQSQVAKRQCSERASVVISRMASSGSWVSIQRPVKQAATSSERRVVSEGGVEVGMGAMDESCRIGSGMGFPRERDRGGGLRWARMRRAVAGVQPQVGN